MNGNRVSGKVPSFNKIIRNIEAVDKGELEKVVGLVGDADVIIFGATGRSNKSLRRGLGGIEGKRIITRKDPDYPGRNIFEVLETSEKQGKEVLLVVNSCSGTTETPRYLIEDVATYIENTGTKKVKIAAITANLDSPIGKIAQKYGVALKLKGTKVQSKTSEQASSLGMMNDLFELGSAMLFQETREALNNGQSWQQARKQIFIEMAEIGKRLDKFVECKPYRKLITKLSTRAHVVIGGYGPSEEVAEELAIRLGHVKESIGDRVDIVGSSASHVRPGDTLIIISCSGETRCVLKWIEKYRAVKETYVFSIVGKKSPISERSDGSFIINKPVNRFYSAAALLLSSIPLDLVRELESNGLVLPLEITNWSHSDVE
ncbi:MAG: SIS domain-containing protein [bacterium]